MQIWAEPEKSALPICNYSQILYQFLTFTQNLKRSPFRQRRKSFLKIIPSPNTTPPSPNSNPKPNNPRQKSPITEPARQDWLFHIIKTIPNHLPINLPISTNSPTPIALPQIPPYTVTNRRFLRKSVDKNQDTIRGTHMRTIDENTLQSYKNRNYSVPS